MKRDGPRSTVRLKTGRHCSANRADPIRWFRKMPPRKKALSPSSTSTREGRGRPQQRRAVPEAVVELGVVAVEGDVGVEPHPLLGRGGPTGDRVCEDRTGQPRGCARGAADVGALRAHAADLRCEPRAPLHRLPCTEAGAAGRDRHDWGRNSCMLVHVSSLQSRCSSGSAGCRAPRTHRNRGFMSRSSAVTTRATSA